MSRGDWLENVTTDVTGAFTSTLPGAPGYDFYHLYLELTGPWTAYEFVSATPGPGGTVFSNRWIRFDYGGGGAVFPDNHFVLQLAAPTSTPTPTPTATPSDPLQTGPDFTVNTSDDSDDGRCSLLHCSLREAINAANSLANGVSALGSEQATATNRILFQLPGNATRIQPGSALPVLSDPVILLGNAGKIEINGSLAGPAADGLVITGGNTTVQGLVVNGFSGNGIVLAQNGGNTLIGNFVGTTFSGLGAAPNGGAGVLVQNSSNNAIGGAAVGTSNLVSGNGGPGVSITGGSQGNQVLGNFIGANVLGAGAIANAVGIRIDGASTNQVGGAASGARNLISGNSGAGVELRNGAGANTVQGNVIGADLAATTPLGNAVGVLLTGASGNNIGGAAAGEGNIIVANAGHGVHLTAGSSTNSLWGNSIGTNVSGADLRNGGIGVRIDGASNSNKVGSNVIAFNSGGGIVIDGAANNTLSQNSIYDNTNQGIDNRSGGNEEVSPPQVAAAAGDQVTGTALPNALVEVFGDDSDEGRYYLGQTTTDAFGNWTFTGTLRGSTVTGTATDAAGNTSEFAAEVQQTLACADTFESNDTWSLASLLAPGAVIESYICSNSDIDFFKVPVAAMAPGSTIVVRLQNLEADLDLALFRPTFDPTDSLVPDLPLQNTRTEDVPVRSLPLQNIPLQNIPLQNIPLQNIPLQNIPLQNIPLQNIPLQNIPLQNIPLQNIPLQNIPLVSHSVNPGVQAETVADRSPYAFDHYYILVAGHNGATSEQPYRLTVEVLPPPGPATCSRTFPFPGTPGAAHEPYPAAETETLFLVPKQRLEQMYGSAAVAPLIAKLQTLAGHASVKGLVLPLESDAAVVEAYRTWDDGHVCDVEAANVVAGAIKNLAATALSTRPNVANLVIVGDDEAVPLRRVPDLVETANEVEYALQALVKENTALYASLANGNMLTDDFYADFEPSLYQGRSLYVPNLALGRLVETPAEMSGLIDDYLSHDGQLQAGKGLVMGYDFLKDSSALIAQSFTAQGLTPTVFNNDTWTANDLRSAFLGSRNDFTSFNAHFTHFLLGPADIQGGGVFSATEVAQSATDLAGTVNFSVGCHSGLNVCDVCTSPLGLALGGDLDFAQAFARKRAVWVGNTGFGYGDDAAPTLSEELLSTFARNLGAAAGVRVGEAFRLAKQDYALNNMGAYGLYDEKILAVSTLYGLPMYRVTVPQVQPEALPALSSEGAARQIGQDLMTRTFNLEPSYTAVQGPQGIYYQGGSGQQALLYNPIQPRIGVDVSWDGPEPADAHGALLTAATYHDIDDFDPVITMPVTETKRYEPNFIYDGWQQSQMARINHFESPSGTVERLVVAPGQFLHSGVDSSDPDNVHVVGTERLYDSLSYTVYYSDADDHVAPMIAQVTVTRAPGPPSGPNSGDTVSVAARVSDESGLERVVATYTENDGFWHSQDLAFNEGAGLWTGEVTGVNGEIEFTIQAVDKAGNVGVTAAKSHLYAALAVSIASQPVASDEGSAVAFGVATADIDVANATSVQWDFGDGLGASGNLTPTHEYRDNGDFAVTVTLTDKNGNTGSGWRQVTIANLVPVVQAGADTFVGQPGAVNLPDATFADAGRSDTHTATVDWGDNSAVEPATVLPTAGGGGGAVSLPAHSFAQPGTYQVEVCVRDKDGGVGCDSLQLDYLMTRQWLPLLQKS